MPGIASWVGVSLGVIQGGLPGIVSWVGASLWFVGSGKSDKVNRGDLS